MKFLDCGLAPLGLYPVVDSHEWIARLLPLGVSTIQLRIKDKTGSALESEIKASIALSEQYKARLFINDYWDLAIEHGAYGVHLGQEDLDFANLEKIHGAGLRLGVSTHSFEEIHRALAMQPSYLAFGPIFPTTSKAMRFAPQGIAQLEYWCRKLSYPVVAIGGIHVERLPAVWASGVSGVALISAITQAEDPMAMTQELLELVKQCQLIT